MTARLREAWDRFWFAPVEPAVVALYRIALGVFVIALYLSLAPNWDLYYGPTGILSMNDPYITSRPQDWWSIIAWLDGLVPIHAYLALGLGCGTMLVLGWRSRLATIVLFVLHSSLLLHHVTIANGEDLVLRMVLFFSCFMPLDVGRSLSARHGRPSLGRERWGLRLVQLGVVLLYVFTQTNKLAWEELWWKGDVLYLLTASSNWGRFPWPALFEMGWATKAATWGSLAVEMSFPVLVWIRRTRLWSIGLLALLHVVIACSIKGATFFNLEMLVTLCAFLRERDLERAGLLRFLSY